MKLSIIIVSWQVKDKLAHNLQALLASSGWQKMPNEDGFGCEIFVVDNNSHDGTVEMVRQDFPQVKLVVNKTNKGFAYAVNQVWPEARGEYVLLLNPDMQVKPDTLDKLLVWADNNPQASAISCKLVNEKGEIIKHVRSFPKLINQLAIIFKLPHLLPSILDNYLLPDFDYDQAMAVDSVRGSFLLLRQSLVKPVGYLDERYFIWFEDVDYCRSLHNLGLSVWYTPVAECVDYVGQSFKQIKTLTAQRYFKDSMLKYFTKWHGGGQVIILSIAWFLIWPIVWLANLFHFKAKQRT